MKADQRRALVQTVRAVLEREADAMLAAAKATREGATHEEAKPENDKDTRAIEASYLAGAQAERVRELRAAVLALDAVPLRDAGEVVGLGALVLVSSEERGVEKKQWYLVAPEGGGAHVTWDGRAVQVVTLRSPLGRALLGKCEGDAVEVTTERGRREYELVTIE